MRRSSSFAPTRRRRSPLGAILLVLLLLILAGLAYLGLTTNEAPLGKIEQDVSNEVQPR